jgi:hypothetical protein
MGRGWGDFFWWRLIWGFAILPPLAVFESWRTGNLDEDLTPVTIGFFVAWEIGVIAVARWRRLWPFNKG